MEIKPHEIHVWNIHLTLTSETENKLFALLSEDERERANNFHFGLHKQRFIAARAALRNLISLYINLPSERIEFAYTEHEKPYLNHLTDLNLQFNLSHSENIAMIAFTLDHNIGIDVEKIQASHDFHGIAKRFFSPKENAALEDLPSHEQMIAFYRIWARKEAVIKAIGKGLSIPLSSFSVSISDQCETIELENDHWTLISLDTTKDYQAALATNQIIETILYQDFF